MPWQPAPIIFPDVELALSSSVRNLLAMSGEVGVFVSNRVPSVRRDRMVIFNRDGGANDGVTDRPRVRCRVWGTTDQGANDLARTIVMLMPRLVDGSPVTRVENVSGPFEVADESGQAQRYLNFVVHTKGSTP